MATNDAQDYSAIYCQRGGSKFAARAVLAMVTLVLSVVVAAESPILGKDAQYYLQAGSLWAEGKVSYAGSLIGTRIFAVVYYHLFQSTFGQSIDSVSISLGVLFLTFCAVAVWLCYDSLRVEALRVVASFLIIVIGFVWIDWRRPQTEPFMVILAIVGLVLMQKAFRAHQVWHQVTLFSLVALMCGVGLGFRTESLILLLSVLLAWLVAGVARHEKVKTIAVSGMMAVTFAAGAQAPGVVFHAFTGQAIPPQLTGYFLFFHPVDAFGNASFGPASAELDKLGRGLLSQAPEPLDIEPIRLGLSGAYNLHGPQYASDLYIRAGFETLAVIPSQIAADTASNALTYLVTKTGAYKMDRRKDHVVMAATRERLADIDRERLEQSQWRFLGDYCWPTATIVDNRTSAGKALDVLDVPHVLWSLPAWVIAALTATALVISIQSDSGPWLVSVALLFYIGSCFAAAFTQGFVDRYWLAASLPLVAAIVITFAQTGEAALKSFRPRGRQQNE